MAGIPVVPATAGPVTVFLSCAPPEKWSFLSIEAGDWLQAGATVLGIGATVALAVGIEAWKRGADNREGLKRLRDVVTRLEQAARGAISDMPQHHPGPEHDAPGIAAASAFMTSIDMFRFVANEVRVRDLDLWSSLGDLESVVATCEPRIRRELRLLEQDGNHPQVYAIARQQFQATAERMLIPMTAVLANLRK